MVHKYDTDVEDKVHWKQWNPGLDHGDRKLGDVLETMPASPPDAIPFLVRLLENPEPPISFGGLFPFPGAINLARHDAVHVLLGRGMLPQDEAFVIGFTMGASKQCHSWHWLIFKFCTEYLYPKYYKFNKDQLIALELGFEKGRTSKARDLSNFPFEDFLDHTVEDLRQRLGINRQSLYAFYRKERLLIPHTRESRRLDYSWMGCDPSYITKHKHLNGEIENE